MKELDFQRELIEQCKLKDRNAQYRLYRMYSKAMYNICCRMLNNDMDAEDVLQNSFVNVYKNLHQFHYKSTPGAWIKRIVINNCINHLKKKRIYFEEVTDVNVSTTDVEESDITYNMDVVNQAIQKLPDGYRMVLNLYLMEGYDHKEIAGILDISEATSKSQYSRARHKVKLILHENFGDQIYR